MFVRIGGRVREKVKQKLVFRIALGILEKVGQEGGHRRELGEKSREGISIELWSQTRSLV